MEHGQGRKKPAEEVEKQDGLKISDKRLEMALKSSNIAMFEYDWNQDIIVHFQNKATAYDMPFIINDAKAVLNSGTLVHESSAPAMREAYRKILAERTDETFRVVVLNKNGEEILTEVHLSAVFDKDNVPVRFIGVLVNINDQVCLETERHYRMAIASGSLSVYEVNFSKDKIMNGLEQWASEFGSADSYTQLMEFLSEKYVHPNDKKRVLVFTDRENIIRDFGYGKSQRVFEYRRRVDKESPFIWVSNTINLVRDPYTGEVKGFAYVRDIHERKEKQLRMGREQQMYDALLRKSDLVYEINVTKNQTISGYEAWEEEVGIVPTKSYSEMMQEFYHKYIPAGEVKAFKEKFSRERLLSQFQAGITEVYHEYRRPDKMGKMVWVSCTMHLFEDEETGDVRLYSYINNIDKKKIKELDLIFKSERDALSGMYNKHTTEKKINEYLVKAAGKQKAAFLIVDIDNFKLVNDNFGHAFGDALLADKSGKLKKLFREKDIVGRIGGDEFVVCIRNLSDVSVACQKAEEICTAVCEAYSKNKVEFVISASVGISFFPEHGSDFATLYKRADIALYNSKGRGKNQYCIYDAAMNHDFVRLPGELEEPEVAKLFAENVNDYVFRILYEAKDKISAVYSVLELIGRKYKLGRVYIAEEKAEKDMGLAFEWCGKEEYSLIDNSAHREACEDPKRFSKNGVFYIPDMETAEEPLRKALGAFGIKSMLQFAFSSGEAMVMIGFEAHEDIWVPSKKEIGELKSISNVLGMFVLGLRDLKKSVEAEMAAISLLDVMDCYAYIVVPDTFEILYMNEPLEKIIQGEWRGKLCYQAFLNQDAPCENCAWLGKNGQNEKKGIVKYSKVLQRHVKCSATPIAWQGHLNACLITAFDVNALVQEAQK